MVVRHSAESFLDRMTEMPDVLELAPTIRCPTLFIRGDEESPKPPAERFKERAGGPCDVEIVPNCNHFYVGREAAICKVVSGWLVRTLNIGAGVSTLISSESGLRLIVLRVDGVTALQQLGILKTA